MSALMIGGITVAPEEAGPLVQVLVDRVAKAAALRAMAIKGPALAIQGLRDYRVSADVDALVHPDDREGLIRALEQIQWTRRSAPTTPPLAPRHAIDLVHAAWPLGIDVHDHFPGFLADPREVFDVLWARRGSIEMAGVTVTVVGPSTHVAVLALHCLREPWASGIDDQLDDLAARSVTVLGDQGLADLSTMAVEAGASGTLAPLLERLGLEHEVDESGLDSERASAWARRTRKELAAMPWLIELHRVPLRRKPAAVKQALLMPEWELRERYADGSTALWRLHARRVREATHRYRVASWAMLRGWAERRRSGT